MNGDLDLVEVVTCFVNDDKPDMESITLAHTKQAASDMLLVEKQANVYLGYLLHHRHRITSSKIVWRTVTTQESR